MNKIVLVISFMLIFCSSGFGQLCPSTSPVSRTKAIGTAPTTLRINQTYSICTTDDEDGVFNVYGINDNTPNVVITIATITFFRREGETQVPVRTIQVNNNSSGLTSIPAGDLSFVIEGKAEGRFSMDYFEAPFNLQSPSATRSIVIDQALPVTWTKPLTYTPRGNEIQLNWSVTDQVDVAGYELERDNGDGFFPVASIPYAPGEGEVNYFALQPWSADGAYYRVKQLDYAGTFDYTNIVFVPGTSSAIALSAFPNPAKDFVQVAVPQEVREVQVLSATGQVMGNYSADQARSGIDLSRMASGVYFVRSPDGSYSVPQRLIVRK